MPQQEPSPSSNRNGHGRANGRPALTETAYDLIKRSIIRCELAPDRQVTEEQLATSFGVGRAAVRAALKRLYQEQLVQIVGRNRYVIAPITLKHANDLFALRLLLEPAAARLAAGRLDADRLRLLNDLSDAEYRVGDPESATVFLAANTAFHAIIAEASGNAALATAVRDVLDKVERVLHMSHLLRNRNIEAAHEHHELLAALAAGDGERAERLMAAQIRASQEFAIQAMLVSPSLQTVNVALDAR